jgi:polysaccharide export outer membrane protein
MRLLFAILLLFISWSRAEAQIPTLQPGDSIAISILQDPKLDRQMLVGPNGMISFPLAGHIRAQGLTTAGLEAVLKRRLKSKYTGELDVTVTYLGLGGERQLLRPRFYVTGEVRAPGAYPLRVRTDIVQGIALAGGLGIFAAKHRIEVRRKVRGADELLLFDYAAYEAGTDHTGNFNLRSGDTIIVPERGLFDW